MPPTKNSALPTLVSSLNSTVTAQWDDVSQAIEACYELGWTDGLPVVPPTTERVGTFLESRPNSLVKYRSAGVESPSPKPRPTPSWPVACLSICRGVDPTQKNSVPSRLGLPGSASQQVVMLASQTYQRLQVFGQQVSPVD